MSFTILAYKFVAAQKHLLCQLLLVFLIQTPDHVTSAKKGLFIIFMKQHFHL